MNPIIIKKLFLKLYYIFRTTLSFLLQYYIIYKHIFTQKYNSRWDVVLHNRI